MHYVCVVGPSSPMVRPRGHRGGRLNESCVRGLAVGSTPPVRCGGATAEVRSAVPTRIREAPRLRHNRHVERAAPLTARISRSGRHRKHRASPLGNPARGRAGPYAAASRGWQVRAGVQRGSRVERSSSGTAEVPDASRHIVPYPALERPFRLRAFSSPTSTKALPGTLLR